MDVIEKLDEIVIEFSGLMVAIFITMFWRFYGLICVCSFIHYWAYCGVGCVQKFVMEISKTSIFTI